MAHASTFVRLARASLPALAAASSAAAALLAACGPSTPPAESPGPLEGEAAEIGTPPPPVEAEADPAKPEDEEHGEPKASIPLAQTQMLAELEKAGLDPNALPPLDKIPLRVKKKIMPALQKSLGYSTCGGCHAEGDFKAETEHKQIARQMWNEFVVKLRDEKGGPIFCDSCHQGREEILARGDKKALADFMQTNYVDKLTRADKQDHECSSCHGEAMEYDIIEKLWGIKD